MAIPNTAVVKQFTRYGIFTPKGELMMSDAGGAPVAPGDSPINRVWMDEDLPLVQRRVVSMNKKLDMVGALGTFRVATQTVIISESEWTKVEDKA